MEEVYNPYGPAQQGAASPNLNDARNPGFPLTTVVTSPRVQTSPRLQLTARVQSPRLQLSPRTRSPPPHVSVIPHVTLNSGRGVAKVMSHSLSTLI